jgi:hypothetical protein
VLLEVVTSWSFECFDNAGPRNAENGHAELQNLDFWYKKSETALEPDHK